jgi:hypothetical protein
MIRNAKTLASLEEAEDAFLRELPVLLRDHEGKWAAYYGVDRVALADTKSAAYTECNRQGLADEDFLVRCIEPPLDEVTFGPDSQSR